jgi:hypothetical protein
LAGHGGPVAGNRPDAGGYESDRARLGPFFAVDHHAPGSLPASPWRPLADLIDDPAVLSDRVSAVRRTLADRAGAPVVVRVAASVLHLGLIARLVSPVIAEAAISGRAAPVHLERWWWRPELGGAGPLSVPRPDEGGGPGPGEFGALAAGLIDGPITKLTVAVGERFAVPAPTLWGNVASALNTAGQIVAREMPAVAGRVELIETALRARPALLGEDGASGALFRRRSCCLIYQVQPGRAESVCGDCVLRR